MRVYVDSSVLLRVVLGESGQLREWRKIAEPIGSDLVRLECLRTIDRARLRLNLEDAEVSDRRRAVLDHLDTFELVELSPVVMARAESPFPTRLGSLDSIHLATAILARDQIPGLKFATHDRELEIAAIAVGFDVLE